MKEDSLFLTKVTRPKLTGIFQRERLFRLIDRGFERPLVWITGPPGCGKTTLVSSFLDERKLPCLWYRIEESDSDIATFFYYMSLAAKKAGHKKEQKLPLFNPEYFKDISKFTRQFFEKFYGCFEKTPFVIVFDNYQEVQGKSLFHKVINIGLLKILKGIHVIIISRSDMPSMMARVRANYLPEVLGWNELRLTYEETVEIVKRKIGKQKKETIELIYNKTGGWLAGLVLMLERAKIENIEPILLNRLTFEEIFDYFATEIFEKMSSENKEFLLKTAFLPRMTPQMAESLTGYQKAGRMLIDLNRSNYFTEKYSQPVPVFQYHPLFREFLLSHSQGVFKQKKLVKIKRDAAEILVGSGLIEDAVELLSEAGNWDEIVKLIYKHAGSLVKQGRYQTVEGWLNILPKEIIEKTPWLMYWKGICRLPFNPGESYVFFERAFQLFNQKKDTTGIFLSWSGAVESIFEDFVLTRLDEWISTFEEDMNKLKFPSDEIEARVASCMFMALVLKYPQHPRIDSWAERAIKLSKGLTNISTKIHTYLCMVWYRIFKGDFAQASIALDSLREIIESDPSATLDMLKLRHMEALYYWMTAMHDKCQKAVTDGLELADRIGVHILDCKLLGHGAANALSSGDMATARRLLQKMSSQSVCSGPWNKSFYYLLKAWEALLLKDMVEALINAEIAVKLTLDTGVVQTEAICNVAKAQVMNELGEKEKAKEILELMRDTGRNIQSSLIEFMCLLTESHLAFDEDDEQGLSFLRKAMSIGKKQGYVNTFIWRPSVMAKLCAKAIENGIEVDYVRDLIKRRGLVHDPTPILIEEWPWPLKIFTLGRFGLVRDGKPVRFSGKVQKKPLSLLKALITLGGREVGEDNLMDILWYEADGDVAHKSFATNLHRLRKLIGNEKAIQLHEGRVTLDSRHCWVDVWAFERILGQIENALKNKPTEDNLAKIIQMAEKAIEMYKGPFLPGETDLPWTLSFRERLRSKFLRMVKKVGIYWEQAESYDKAIHCYQKGLEVDDLAEEFYQRLMRCYCNLGRHAEALNVYSRCRNTLSSILGIKPSAETETISKSIIRR
jgi:LuxR family maltose regulon positive regulatory protein